jgi:hypothetical protein
MTNTGDRVTAGPTISGYIVGEWGDWRWVKVDNRDGSPPVTLNKDTLKKVE